MYASAKIAGRSSAGHHGPRQTRATARSRRMQPVIYPVRFSVDYPDRPLNRLTTFFRVFTAIPVLVLLCSVSGGTWQWSSGKTTSQIAAGAGGPEDPRPAGIAADYGASWKGG